MGYELKMVFLPQFRRRSDHRFVVYMCSSHTLYGVERIGFHVPVEWSLHKKDMALDSEYSTIREYNQCLAYYFEVSKAN